MKKLFFLVLIIIIPITLPAATLTWDSLEQSNITYNVLIRDKGQTDVDYKILYSGLKTNIAQITVPISNHDYEIGIQAVNECGIKSLISNFIPYNECTIQTIEKVKNVRIIIELQAK